VHMPQEKEHLHGWVKYFNSQIEWLRKRRGCALRDLPLAQIARGLLGRPNVDPGGPTYMNVLDPLMNTDTKAHVDLVKIIDHLDGAIAKSMAHEEARGGTCDDGLFPYPTLAELVRIDVSDGQSNKLEGHHLKRNPGTHRMRVPVDGPMHA
jgi:hypothetical protein